MIGNIVGTIKNLFGGDSYYLEDKSESNSEETSPSTPVVEEKSEPAKAETVEAKSEADSPAPTEKTESKKTDKKKSQKKTTTKTKTPQPKTSGSPSSPRELIQAAVNKPLAQKKETESSEQTFAPKYLLYTKTQAKRSPGACMSSFLDMARKMR